MCGVSLGYTAVWFVRWNFMCWLVLFIIVIVDQLCKIYARCSIKGTYGFEFLNGLVKFVYLENRGAAFGILKDSRYIFIASTLIIITGLFYVILYKKINDKLFKIGATFIASGGFSNLIDRLFLGYVIDYIKLSFFSPVCNLADYFITVGTIILIIYILKHDNKSNNIENISRGKS